MEAPTTAVPPNLIACSLSEQELGARSESLQRELFAAAAETRELADGYAWRFASGDELTETLLAFIAGERRCCSFFRIELEFAPALGPVWLRIRGPEGVKAFIRRAFAGSPGPLPGA